MTTPEILGISVAVSVPLLTWAMQWGSIRTQAKLRAEQTARIEHSIENFGGRLGGLEQVSAVLVSKVTGLEQQMGRTLDVIDGLSRPR